MSAPVFPAGAQASEAVQPRETPLHDPAVGAQSHAVEGAAAGDGWHDPRRGPHTGPNAQLPPQTRKPGAIQLIVLAVVRSSLAGCRSVVSEVVAARSKPVVSETSN